MAPAKAAAPSRAWGWGQKEGKAPRPPGRRPSRSSARRSDHGRAVEGGPAGVAAARGVRPPARPPTIDAGFGATVWRHGLTWGRPRACGGHIIADSRATYRTWEPPVRVLQADPILRRPITCVRCAVRRLRPVRRTSDIFPHTRSFPVLRVYSTAIQIISKRNAAWDTNYHRMNKYNLEILWPPTVVQAKTLTRKRIS